MHRIMSWQRVANTCECCEEPDAGCPTSQCLAVTCTSYPLPISCTFTGYPFNNEIGVTCLGICNDMVMTTDASIRACYGCPWCEDEGDPDCTYCGWCYGELDGHTGTFEICTSGFCLHCYGSFQHDSGQIFNHTSPCGMAGWGADVESCGGTIHPPEGHNQDVDLESIFTAYSVTYSASAMGSHLLTKNSEDLCAVWGYASIKFLTIVYVYETTGGHVGGCRKYCFETNKGLQHNLVASAGDHINCVNAQTTGSSIYDLGLTATGYAPAFMYDLVYAPNVGEWVRLDTGGTVDVKTYPPPKCYFTFDGQLCLDPTSCDPTLEGLTWSMVSDTKQRTHTGLVWDEAYCPYNYSWSVSDIGANIQTMDCVFSSA